MWSAVRHNSPGLIILTSDRKPVYTRIWSLSEEWREDVYMTFIPFHRPNYTSLGQGGVGQYPVQAGPPERQKEAVKKNHHPRALPCLRWLGSSQATWRPEATEDRHIGTRGSWGEVSVPGSQYISTSQVWKWKVNEECLGLGTPHHSQHIGKCFDFPSLAFLDKASHLLGNSPE